MSPVHRGGRGRVDDLAEQAVLGPAHERAGAEHADELVGGEQHHGEERDPPERGASRARRGGRAATRARARSTWKTSRSSSATARWRARAIAVAALHPSARSSSARWRPTSSTAAASRCSAAQPARVRSPASSMSATPRRASPSACGQHGGDLEHGALDDGRVGALEPGARRARQTPADLAEAGAGGRGRGQHRDPEPALELRGLDADAEVARLVLQVEDEHLRAPELGELRGEVEHAAEVLRVPDLDDDRVGLGEQDVARHLLVLRLRRQRVGPGRVDDLGHAGEGARPGAGDLDGGPGVVRDGDVRPGERAEDHALPDVGVAHQQQRRLLGARGEVWRPAHARRRERGRRRAHRGDATARGGVVKYA